MRRLERGDVVLLVVGAALLACGLWVTRIPPAVHPLWIYKAWVGKLTVLAAGLATLVAGVASWASERPLLARRRVREGLANGALAVGSVALVLVLAEAALELTAPRPPENWIQPDPVFHHSQKPGIVTRFVSTEWDTEVRINSLGLRNPELSPRVPGRTLVVVMGDSYVFGYGVEADEAFPRLVEGLCRSSGRDIEVVNAGIPSYSPTLEYLFLREHWSELEPDVLVLALDMSDFQDDLWFESLAERAPDGTLLRVRPAPRPGRLKLFYKNLLLVRMLRSGLDDLYTRFRSGRELGLPQTRDLLRNRFALTRDDVPPDLADPHWRRTLGWVGRVADLVAEHGARFLLITYPYGHQVSPEEWEDGRQHYGFAADKVYPDTPQRRIAQWAAAAGVPFLGMFDAFRARADGSFYFDRDGHFTAKGHRLAADLLYQKLVQLHWIEPASLPML